MSTQRFVAGLMMALVVPLSAHALTFTWDVPQTQQTTTPPQWELFLTKAAGGDVSQQTEPLTTLDEASCQQIYHDAGDTPPYNAEGKQSYCATLTCPGPGAYTALLHVEGETPTVQNSSSFGLDAECKMISYDEALMAALPADGAPPTTGAGTKPPSGTDVADATDPANPNDPDKPQDQGQSGTPTTPAPSTGTKPTTGTPPSGGTTTGTPGKQTAALPAPRVLDVAAPTGSTTTPGTTPGNTTPGASGGTTTPGTTGTPTQTSGGTTPSTGGTTTGSTTPGTPGSSPSSGTTPPAGTSPGTPPAPGQVFTDLTKQFQELGTAYQKKLQEVETWYKGEIQKILTSAKKDGNTQLAKLYQQAQQKQFDAYLDASSKWEDLYGKAVAQNQQQGTSPTGTAQTGSGTPASGTSPTGTAQAGNDTPASGTTPTSPAPGSGSGQTQDQDPGTAANDHKATAQKDARTGRSPVGGIGNIVTVKAAPAPTVEGMRVAN